MTNFASHVKDAGLNPDTIPLTFFRKTSGSISGPFDDIVRPDHVRFLDYEVEIGLVIGRELPVGTQVTEDNWTSFVAGLVVTNDVSARDVQLPKTQFFESKSYPTFTPVGPSLVLLDDDELKRFGDLRLRLWVNGELRQDSVVDGDMIYSPLRGAAGAEPVPAARPGRPAPHRDPGGHRPERTAEAGRVHRRVPAARAEVEALLPAPGPEPQVPQARRRRRGRHRHRRRRHRPRPAAHRREERLMGDLLWPTYDAPADLAAIEAVPLADRGLPGTTYELLVRAAGLWPERVALSVLPDGERWEQPAERTYAELLTDVHRYANVFHALGVRRTDGVALLAPNCDELVTATLAAELAGIAAPINSGLSRQHIAELLRRSGARVLVAAGPDLAPDVWESARELAAEAGMEAAARPAPDRRAARRRRSWSRSTASGSATCPRWRQSSRTTPSWESRPRPPTSPLSSTPAARRARRSSPRTPTPTRSATPG